MRLCVLCVCATVAAAACAPSIPKNLPVAVYQAPLDGPQERRAMPDGCTLIARSEPAPMTEAEMEGQSDPYRRQRTEAADKKGNVLLVLSRIVTPRRDFECPTASPIKDCPASSGAWLSVVFESYTCTPDAQKILATPKPKS